MLACFTTAVSHPTEPLSLQPAGAAAAAVLLQPAVVRGAVTVSLGASGAIFGLFAVSVLTRLSWDPRKLLEGLTLGNFVVRQVSGPPQLSCSSWQPAAVCSCCVPAAPCFVLLQVRAQLATGVHLPCMQLDVKASAV
jgi:hypothetical protein